MALSACQMFAAAFGWLPPRASALMQELVDLSALVHSLQVRYHPECLVPRACAVMPLQ
jgi:hypothetical protein